MISAITRERLRLLVLVLLWVLTWSFLHGYDGIQQDGRLYTLQALSHLRPQPLAHDIFVSFGSQDRYTVFSPVYAAVMSRLGIEPAAAILTLTSQLALLAGAFLLARTLVSPTLALLGLSVLIAIPGFYGAARVFSCLESYVTPRMAAEALVLCGLAAALSRRACGALVLITLATLLHPIMAAAGLVALSCVYIAIPRPRLGVWLCATTLLALVGISLTWPAGLLGRFDAQWLRLVQLRSPNLFLANWTADDWGRAIVPLATLGVGVGTLTDDRARRVCKVGLIAGLGGLVLTQVACDLLRLVLVTQLQPWRWLWLTTTLSAILLPAITVVGWQAGAAARATVLLLATAWVYSPDALAPVLALTACLSMLLFRGVPPNVTQLIFYGTCGLLVVSMTARLAWNSIALESHYYDPAIPAWFRDAASFLQGGLVVVMLATLTVWLASRPHARAGLLVLAALGVGVCIWAAPPTWRRWTHEQFPPVLTAQFTPWRALIPPEAPVLWPESPVEASVLLDRPDYLSLPQTAGLVFSRAGALEMRRRAIVLAGVTPPDSFFQFSASGMGLAPTAAQLGRACRGTEVQFLVTAARLGWPPLAEISAATWPSRNGLRLYRCSDRAPEQGTTE